MKKVIKTLVKWGLIAFGIACFMTVAYQRIKGEDATLFKHSVFVILTDSMTPVYVEGDVILVRHVDPSKVELGDVITFHTEINGADVCNTHKVVREPEFIDGVYHFQTQGVKEGATLDDEITEDALVGVVVTKLRVITFLYKVISNIYGFVFIIVVPMMLLLVLQFIQLKNNEKEEEKHAKEKAKSSTSTR